MKWLEIDGKSGTEAKRIIVRQEGAKMANPLESLGAVASLT